jgi:predicted phage terminase large subunit-like protein
MANLVNNLTAADVLAARKELSKRSLSTYATLIDIPTAPTNDDDVDTLGTIRIGKLASHHNLLLNKLQDLEEGLIPNLMVFMPPGSAKSIYCDVVFVPWFMARKPRRNVILASYASDIASKQGRRARQLVKSDQWSGLMDVSIDGDNAAADRWALSNGSEYMAGGLLSGLTGNRAHLGIIDDPLQGREQAESETIRNKCWDAYQDDFCSRLIPGAPQIMILTRWHEDDLAGRILPDGWDGESGDFKGRDGRNWHVICLPAIADRGDDPLKRKIGDVLWPEWFSKEHFAPFMTNRRTWTSLYQQKPSPEDGDFFRKEWFVRYDKLPDNLYYYGASDYAVTDSGGDYTEHGIFGVDADSNIYVVDWWRGQTTPDIWIEKKLDLVKKWKPLKWFGEGGVIRRSVEPFLIKRMRERRTFQVIEWLTSISDKPTRARAIQGRMAQKLVFFPKNAPWANEVENQLLKFPNGKHDDSVDVMSILGRGMDLITSAGRPTKKEEVVDKWLRIKEDVSSEDWKLV